IAVASVRAHFGVGTAGAGLMRHFVRVVWRLLKGLPAAVLVPLFLAIAAATLYLMDLFTRRGSGTGLMGPASGASEPGASIVIPNWNGRDLLAKYLPSVIAAADRCPGTEVIVVDNGSSDGSAAFLRETFPSVRVIALETNLGFGGGSNEGFRQAHHDIV